MKDELSVFKKHLGEIEGVSEFKASTICSQINDANDFIGALQVLDLTLKKIHQSLSQRTQSLDDLEKRNLDAMASALIQNCSFMGTALFGNIFNVYVGKQLFEFEISNPLLILKNSDYKGVLAYVEDKRDEIKGILSQIGNALISASDINAGIYGSTTDFKSLFK